MIETALSLGDLRPLGYKGAVAYVKANVSDPEMRAALLFNLDPKTDGGWRINLKAIDQNKQQIFGFKTVGEFDGPALMLNGQESFQ